MAHSQKSNLRSVAPPPVVNGSPCAIQFGHNTTIRRVLMRFEVQAQELIFTPEEARDVAEKLRQYADLSDGTKAN